MAWNGFRSRDAEVDRTPNGPGAARPDVPFQTSAKSTATPKFRARRHHPNNRSISLAHWPSIKWTRVLFEARPVMLDLCDDLLYVVDSDGVASTVVTICEYVVGMEKSPCDPGGSRIVVTLQRWDRMAENRMAENRSDRGGGSTREIDDQQWNLNFLFDRKGGEHFFNVTKSRGVVHSFFGDRYTFNGFLSSGSYADVYRVFDKSGDACAVKLVKRRVSVTERSDTSSREQLWKDVTREANILAKIQGSLGIPKFHGTYVVNTRNSDTGVVDAVRIGLVMQYFPLSMRDLRDKGVLSEGRALPLMRGVLQGLGSLHAHGLAHRDIKLSNIMLASPTEGPVYLVDFGFAKWEEENNFGKSIPGTLGYMAPELFDYIDGLRDDIDWRLSDVFSAGAVMHRLLSKKSPFPGSNSDKIMQSNRKRDIDFSDLNLSKCAMSVLKGMLRNCEDRPLVPEILACAWFMQQAGSIPIDVVELPPKNAEKRYQRAAAPSDGLANPSPNRASEGLSYRRNLRAEAESRPADAPRIQVTNIPPRQGDVGAGEWRAGNGRADEWRPLTPVSGEFVFDDAPPRPAAARRPVPEAGNFAGVLPNLSHPEHVPERDAREVQPPRLPDGSRPRKSDGKRSNLLPSVQEPDDPPGANSHDHDDDLPKYSAGPVQPTRPHSRSSFGSSGSKSSGKKSSKESTATSTKPHRPEENRRQARQKDRQSPGSTSVDPDTYEDPGEIFVNDAPHPYSERGEGNEMRLFVAPLFDISPAPAEPPRAPTMPRMTRNKPAPELLNRSEFRDEEGRDRRQLSNLLSDFRLR